MAVEIERKFLVCDSAWLVREKGERLSQGYIDARGCTVRVRIAGERGYLTLKGSTQGISRDEFEYEIPFADADAMLRSFCGAKVEKTRYKISVGQHHWDVDVFAGENEGLIVAEIELGSENEAFEKPLWLGKEVSDDPRYFNSALARTPFRKWK